MTRPATSSEKPSGLRRSARALGVSLLCLGLANCSTIQEVAEVAGEVATLGVAVGTLGLVSLGGASGSGGGGYRSSGVGSVALPPSNGYSQRGAFEDCQRMYAAAGMHEQARTCAQRATNMGSLR